MSGEADIRELAVAAWRLEKWLDNLKADRKMAAKSALRSIKKYIAESGVEIKDPVGSKFDPGLAVEVVNNEAEDAPEEELIIIETLSPYIYLKGELIQHARVIIGATVKAAHSKNAIICNDTQTETESTMEPLQRYVSETKPSTDDEPESKDININPDDIERMMAYAKIF